VYRTQLEDILAEGRRLLDAEDFLGAYNKYTSGFSIYKLVFTNSDYDRTVKNTVEQTTAMLTNYAGTVNSAIAPVEALHRDIIARPRSSITAEQTTEADRLWANMAADVDSLQMMKQQIWNAYGEIVGIPRDEKMGEGRHYLNFARLLLDGRPDEDKSEGLLGVIDGLYEYMAYPLAERYLAIIEGEFE
jgi:hypothetical protein